MVQRERNGSVLDSRAKGRGFEPHPRHCVVSLSKNINPHYVVSLSKNINPSLELVQPRKTRPFITERLLIGRKESNQTNIMVTCMSLGKYKICYFQTPVKCQEKYKRSSYTTKIVIVFLPITFNTCFGTQE